MSNKPTIAALIGLILSVAVACDSGPSCISPVPTPNACPGNGGSTVGVGADDDYGNGGYEQPTSGADAGSAGPGKTGGDLPAGLDAFMGGGGGQGGENGADGGVSHADVPPPEVDLGTEGGCGASADTNGDDASQIDGSGWGCEPDADAGPSDDAAPQEDAP